ncbi:MAG: thiamine pyrophosphate-binding protein [Mariprofundaceae bacterium]|nr:thiamine pyrophosphate-binding protein [Mariprofundaceae bacterium]
MGKIRVADYVTDFLYSTLGVDDVFLVTGGGAMFLNDGIAKHENINAILNHHEQASAMAAVAYAKYKNSYAVAMTTSGCGATNAVTGLLDAWQDNTPVIFISGQVKKKETVHNSELALRQLGVQEADIISIVSSISKYSFMVNDPKDIAYHMEKAAFLATIGRPGPVWIDIPQDVQGAIIEESEMIHFDSSEIEMTYKEAVKSEDIASVLKDIKASTRPMIIAGNGIRLGDARSEFNQFIEKFKIPVATSYLGIDLLPSDSPYYVGRLGIKGDRAGNFAIQNSDLVIVLGSRLAVALTGFEYELFAREAKLIVVDIDAVEHQKNTVKIDQLINTDVKQFLKQMNSQTGVVPKLNEWMSKCQYWREQWPVALDEYELKNEKVNKYTFIDRLSKYTKDDMAIVADAGSAYYVTAQALKIKGNQRYITSGAEADMGFTIPAAIGVSVAKKGEVVAITGDGSFQMNIQELQTIFHYQLPIKIFVLNNNGYLSIRTTQNKFFEGRLLGTEPSSGISFPDLRKIAEAYGYVYFSAKVLSELDEALESTMTTGGPIICEIFCPEYQEIVPTVSSAKRADGSMVSKPNEDMYPFLERNEFLKEMCIKPVSEK